jgi:hypothetical protein
MVGGGQGWCRRLIFEKIFWWGWLGLNQRPTGYEPAALTAELHPQPKYFFKVWVSHIGLLTVLYHSILYFTEVTP